ncbi:metal ABC transporter substrate-binding protein [Patescibacteria group bacterium]|nr:metal ABC transporter substrate-binding protein [Patescibacteria group bacterium]MBU1922164.1 metal ABC transporter substrate-binding protein [Patescibacteria group bacterium]
MKKILLIIGIILLVLGGLFYYFMNSEKPTQQSEIKIAATIFPIYDIAKNIVSDKMDTELISPPGASPHTFEVTAEQIKKLQNAKIIFAIGHGLDDWILKVQDALPQAQIKTVSPNIELSEFGQEHEHEEAEEREEEHEHTGIDPHYWLTMANAKIIARNILQEMQNLDPANREYYEKNYQNYIQELDDADKNTHDLLDEISSREIITMHTAWSYFSREYGLEVVATFEPFPGQEPSPQYLVELSKATQEHDIKTIFSEPQLSNEALIPFLRDLGVTLKILDPLGGLAERDSYINMMLYNAQTIHDALK